MPDLTPVQSLVANLFGFGGQDVAKLAEQLFAQSLEDYNVTLVGEARAAGYTVSSATVSDAFVLDKLRARADFAANSIGNSYNNELKGQIAQIAADVPTANRWVYCLAPKTRVLTAGLHWKPLGDLNVGDQLVAFDECPGEIALNTGFPTRRRWRSSVVEAVGTERLPSFQITFRDGTCVTASSGHRWLCRNGHEPLWRTTSDLFERQQFVGKSGHGRLVRPFQQVAKIADVWSKEESWRIGFLAAAFAGEGWLTQSVKDPAHGLAYVALGFAQKDGVFLNLVSRALTELKYEFTIHRKTHAVAQLILRGGKPQMLQFLGQVRPPRLIEKFDPERWGVIKLNNWVDVVAIEPIGDQEVVTIGTSTRTLIAEGFASHNSKRLETWDKARMAGKVEEIAVTEQGYVMEEAKRDFVERNGLEGRGRVLPESSAEPICANLVGLGWLTAEQALALPIPAHPNCAHFIHIEYSGGPDRADLWLG